MIPKPEKEHSHRKKHDTVKPFRQGDSRTSRAAGRCPPSLSFLSLQPPAGLSRAWARPASPTCVQGSVCAAIFLQSRKSRERGQDQRQILQVEWSSRNTGQHKLFELHQKQRDQQRVKGDSAHLLHSRETPPGVLRPPGVPRTGKTSTKSRGGPQS